MIKVGSRQIDVTGLSDAMIKKVTAAAKNGGSTASRALAQQFQKQTGGPSISSKTPQTGGPGQAQGQGTQLPQTDPRYQPNADGLAWNNWESEVIPTQNVQIPKSVAAPGQYKQSSSTLAKNTSGIDKATGQIDPNRSLKTAYELERADAQKNFNMNNPGLQVDEFGNSQHIVFDPDSGATKVIKAAGGTLGSTMEAFEKSIGGYQSDFGQAVNSARDANYNYLTRNMRDDKQQEQEAAKQELANRGIPIDPSEGSLWQKTLAGIDRKYQGLTDQANNQAIMQGNETLGAQVGAQNSMLGTLTNTAQAFRQAATPYAGTNIDQSQTFQQGVNTASGADLEKYKADLAYKAAMKKPVVAAAPAPKDPGPQFNG